MLIIRKEQIKVFEEYTLQRYKARILVHLMEIWPERCRELGEEYVRESIEKGIKSATSYGITAENDVVGYIDLMYVLSMDFDADPTMHWAASILQDQDLLPHKKIEMLYEMTEQVLGISSINPYEKEF
jgi:hypothetical protein